MSAPGIYLQPIILYLQSITLQDILTSIYKVDIKNETKAQIFMKYYVVVNYYLVSLSFRFYED